MTNELKSFKMDNYLGESGAHSRIRMHLCHHSILRKLHVNFPHKSRKINSYNIILLTKKPVLCQTAKNS